ncbi:peptidoglycan recognition protein 1-like [Pyxicephalus adspersus]|uniref:peptidoglycan recognition protein 1-like n=1 Tax=Pyxicephalus adspersus TaxID=30357 RepID=UPI003B5A2C20
MIYFVVLLSVLCAAVHAQFCPTIVSRAQWGAKNPRCTKLLSTPVSNVIIHHTSGSSCSSMASCRIKIRSLQYTHMVIKGLEDIGYNFLIGEDGAVYEGRGWKTNGGHASNYNSISTGIGFIGSYTNHVPNTAAQNAAKQLIACGVERNYIKKTYALKGHRDVKNTKCPGDSFYKAIQKWAHFKA